MNAFSKVIRRQRQLMSSWKELYGHNNDGSTKKAMHTEYEKLIPVRSSFRFWAGSHRLAQIMYFGIPGSIVVDNVDVSTMMRSVLDAIRRLRERKDRL